MKIAGWICTIFGVLAFIGAVSKGDNVFGPLCFSALGIFLLYRSYNKANYDANNKDCSLSPEKRIVQSQREDADSDKSKLNAVQASTQTANQQESLGSIQSQLTLEQREAAMCLISFFGGFNDNLTDELPMMIFRQAGAFFDIPVTALEVSKMMSKYPDSDMLIDTVLTIKPRKAKEFLLLTCYDLVRTVDNPDASFVLYNIANDMGYDNVKFENLVSLYR